MFKKTSSEVFFAKLNLAMNNKKPSLALVTSAAIIVELLIYAIINAYWESSDKNNGGLGLGLTLDAILVVLSAVNVILILTYLVRVVLKRSTFNPLPIILGLLCLWVGMRLFQ